MIILDYLVPLNAIAPVLSARVMVQPKSYFSEYNDKFSNSTFVNHGSSKTHAGAGRKNLCIPALGSIKSRIDALDFTLQGTVIPPYSRKLLKYHESSFVNQ